MTSISGLDEAAAAEVAAAFGVAHEQVRRDHLVSLLLAALSKHADELIFFGGTALARTHLPAGRLSEDIDLIATGDRARTGERITRTATRALLPTYGRVIWTPALTAVRDTEAAVLRTEEGLTVRLQLLRADGQAPWPTESRDLHQRYADAPPARLRVPTAESFAAWKTAAWHDRSLPRDLYDLWALAGVGAITEAAGALFAAYGPIGAPPRDWMFATAPSAEQWRNQLAGQTRLEVAPREALDVVRQAWREATG
ncbi:MAG: nucleotidyl transferase AbiEii/AbiGii toxin family protein [Actinomycetota bacterium]|nr:nucleotidyl transferase AbiEii/AbiGii toxin family protein [Actinomycetota bacterium]